MLEELLTLSYLKYPKWFKLELMHWISRTSHNTLTIWFVYSQHHIQNEYTYSAELLTDLWEYNKKQPLNSVSSLNMNK